jgi:hypothetical protein
MNKVPEKKDKKGKKGKGLPKGFVPFGKKGEKAPEKPKK